MRLLLGLYLRHPLLRYLLSRFLTLLYLRLEHIDAAPTSFLLGEGSDITALHFSKLGLRFGCTMDIARWQAVFESACVSDNLLIEC